LCSGRSGCRHQDAQARGIVRNHAGKSLGRGIKLQPRRQCRSVGKRHLVGQSLVLRIGESIGRQRKIDRLSLLPRLARRLRADDWSLRYDINGEFPPIAPIGAVEGTDGDSVDSTAGAGLQSHGREVGGIDGDGIRRGVGEDIGAIDQKSVISCTASPGLVELIFRDRLASQRIAGDEQRASCSLPPAATLLVGVVILMVGQSSS
jgi:hypothetical protein